MAMNIFLWIVVGLVTGSMARKLMPGPAAGGISVAILIGLMGATVGGLVGIIFLRNTGDPSNHLSVLTAVNGALYPLFLYRCFAMRSRTPLRPSRESTKVSAPAPKSAVRSSGRPSVVPGIALPVGAND
jgi:uncharacterized membrane protein YeaQ/YmgE (transglycosylase-associated protein family)